MTEQAPRRFHLERWSVLILAVASFLILNRVDFGVCSTEDDVTTCVVGDTLVTDTGTLFLAFTPIVFGPLIFLVVAVSPGWRRPLGLVAQIFVVTAGLGIIAAGFAFLGWGAGAGGVVALLVGTTGTYLGFRSWRARQLEPD